MSRISWVLEHPGGGLTRLERALPQPQRGQALVRNLATAVNFHDILNLQGVLPNLAWPRVPFSDNCGEIVALGEDCGSFAVGDRVLANFFPDWSDGRPTYAACLRCYGDQIDGFLQTHTIVETRSLVLAPRNLSSEEAATLCCAGLTAWRSVFGEARVQPGEAVVVQGTGGVSLFALQLAKLAGANVILISSSDEKLEIGRKLGADHLINYRDVPAWDEVVLDISKGGAALVVEIGGAETLTRSINATQYDGHISIIGIRSGFGRSAPIAPETVLIKNLTLRGLSVGNVRQLDQLCRAVELHDLHPYIGEHADISEAPRALQIMEDQRHVGKIAISIGQPAKLA